MEVSKIECFGQRKEKTQRLESRLVLAMVLFDMCGSNMGTQWWVKHTKRNYTGKF